VKNGTKIMIQINIYMHFLTQDEDQHSKMRNVPRMWFVYMSSVYFCNLIYFLLKLPKIFVNYTLYFITVIPGYTISGTNDY